jgi:hypothetical protein
MYSLGVGVSTVFEILGHFLFKGGQDHPYGHDLHTIRWSLTQRNQMVLDTRNKNLYGLGVGFSIVFEIFSNFPFLGGGFDPRGHA